MLQLLGRLFGKQLQVISQTTEQNSCHFQMQKQLWHVRKNNGRDILFYSAQYAETMPRRNAMHSVSELCKENVTQ